MLYREEQPQVLKGLEPLQLEDSKEVLLVEMYLRKSAAPHPPPSPVCSLLLLSEGQLATTWMLKLFSIFVSIFMLRSCQLEHFEKNVTTDGMSFH